MTSKRFLLPAVLLTLFCAAQAWGVDVYWSFADAASRKQAIRTVYLYPDLSTVTSTNTITRDRVLGTTDADGSITVSNLVAGDYRAEFAGKWGTTTNWYSFPDTNGMVLAKDYQVAAPTAVAVSYVMRLTNDDGTISLSPETGKGVVRIRAVGVSSNMVTRSGSDLGLTNDVGSVVTVRAKDGVATNSTVELPLGIGDIPGLQGQLDAAGAANVTNFSTPTHLIFKGDSLTAGIAGGASFPGYVTNLYLTGPNAIFVTNAGASGELIATMDSDFATEIAPLVPGAGTNSILTVNGGINDLSDTLENIWSYTTNVWFKARTNGFTRIVHATIPLRGGMPNSEILKVLELNQRARRSVGLPYGPDWIFDMFLMFPQWQYNHRDTTHHDTNAMRLLAGEWARQVTTVEPGRPSPPAVAQQQGGYTLNSWGSNHIAIATKTERLSVGTQAGYPASDDVVDLRGWDSPKYRVRSAVTGSTDNDGGWLGYHYTAGTLLQLANLETDGIKLSTPGGSLTLGGAGGISWTGVATGDGSGITNLPGVSAWTITTTDWTTNTWYTNSSRHATVTCSVVLNPTLAVSSGMILEIDQDGNGTIDTGIETSFPAGAVAAATSAQLGGSLKPNARWRYRYFSSGSAVAGIISGSCQKVEY